MTKLRTCVAVREVWEKAHIERYLTLKPYEVKFGPNIFLLTLPLVPLAGIDDLDPMSLGYIRAALKTFPGYTIGDIKYSTVEQMRDDCVRFWYGHDSLFCNLWYGGDVWDIDPYTETQAGRDFWYSRNRVEAKGFLRHTDLFDTWPFWHQLNRVAGYEGPYALHEHKGKLRGHNEL